MNTILQSISSEKWLPFFSTKQRSQKELDLRVAKEAALNLTVQAAALAFHASIAVSFGLPCSALLVTGALVGISLVTLADTVDYVIQRLGLFGGQPRTQLTKLYSQAAKTGALFSVIHCIGLAGPLAYIHENGHALAARLLIQDSYPKIHIEPFGNSTTSYFLTHSWTTLGSKLGPTTSLAVIALAGIASSVAFYILFTTVAYVIKEKYPQCARIAKLWAASQWLSDVAYGLLTLSTAQNARNDFVKFQSLTGISTGSVVTCLIAVPALYRVALATIKCYNQPAKQKKEHGWKFFNDPISYLF